MLKNLRSRLGLVVAGMLASAVGAALALAIFDPGFRAILKDFQVAVGGVGALAAALVAHDGSTASVREAQRRDARERKELKHKLLIQAFVDIVGFRANCTTAAGNIGKYSDRTPEKIIMNLLISVNLSK